MTFLVTRIYIVVTGASLNWNLTCITKGLAYDAVWSPDGSRISYVSRETGIDEIYVFDIGTETTRRLTTTPNFSNAGFFIYNQRPSWSPNGMQLVFKSNRDTNHFQIWNMNADGSAPRIISPSPYNDSDPIWVK